MPPAGFMPPGMAGFPGLPQGAGFPPIPGMPMFNPHVMQAAMASVFQAAMPGIPTSVPIAG
jgi:hypothetical protein